MQGGWGTIGHFYSPHFTSLTILSPPKTRGGGYLQTKVDPKGPELCQRLELQSARSYTIGATTHIVQLGWTCDPCSH